MRVRRILGVVAPILVGMVFIALGLSGALGPGQRPGGPAEAPSQLLTFGAVLLLCEVVAGLLSGYLLQNWWALLVVLVELAVFAWVIALLTPNGVYLGDNLANQVFNFVVVSLALVVALLPAVLATAVGVWLGGRGSTKHAAPPRPA